MTGLIELEDMEFHAFHGCMEEERIIGNTFLVTLHVNTDVSLPCQTDAIADALNYQTLYDLVKVEMKQPSALLEYVCNRILDAVYVQFGGRIISASIKVSKCNPPLGGKLEKVSLTLSR